MASLRVDVNDRCEHPGDRENTALIKLMDGDKCLMTEAITGTSSRHASKMAHERADDIRFALGLLNIYSVSDGASKLCDVRALDLTDALRKLSMYTLDPKYRSLRIDLVEKAE